MSEYSVISPENKEWDAYVLGQKRSHILQLSGWGDLKSEHGWQAERIGLALEGELVAGAQILYRPLPFRLGAMAYIPMGAYVKDAELYPRLWKAIEQRVKSRRVAFLKWEPGYFIEETALDPSQWGFEKSIQCIQPPRTIYITLDPDDETILARMNQGTRRKVRKGLATVQYEFAGIERIQAFSELMQVTGARNDFGVHDSDYYQKVVEAFVPQQGTLIFANHEGVCLAAIMVLYTGDTAWYMYGASSNEQRNLMASYGIQWQAIQ
ncbi:peptidoglycan bridge formation glycyltransferase FemA/FemB family protein [Anaerolineales bacterium]